MRGGDRCYDRSVTSEARAPVKEGDVVADKYRIEGRLGSGGMGVVMAARHLALGEPVALKFVTEGRGGDREATSRMMREARATFRLRSEHTVRVFDVGELPSGPLYIVMELLEGRDLRAELQERGPLPEDEVVRYALEACDALEEAHALGIVHRDLKPHNMFLARSPRGTTVLKILDFGMSKLDPDQFDTEAGPLTRPETALGTPRYMAPEQWKSATEVDARADVWALGAERLARLLAGAIEDPRELRAEVSEPVARAIMRCLRADPEVRWPSVAHLRTALRDAAPGLTRGAPRAEVTRTDVTHAVPPDVMKERAARAFAGDHAQPERPGPGAASTAAPPTRRATPAALQHEPPSPEDFEAATEVRPPQFTPSSLVVGSGRPAPPAAPPEAAIAPRPPAGPRTLASKAHAATLRSAASGPGLDALLHSPPPGGDALEKTRPMPGAPVRPSPVAPTIVEPLRAPSPPMAAPLPAPVAPRPLAAAPKQAQEPRFLVRVVAAGLLSAILLALIVWWVTRQLAR